MATVTMNAVLDKDIKTVWDTITSLSKYTWRSDLSKIERRSDTQFVEYTKDGYATRFTITIQEPYKRWEFDMENDNIKGHWTGIFTADGERTEIEFTETVTAKKIWMKPFVNTYLKKQQAQYITDLKQALC